MIGSIRVLSLNSVHSVLLMLEFFVMMICLMLLSKLLPLKSASARLQKQVEIFGLGFFADNLGDVCL